VISPITICLRSETMHLYAVIAVHRFPSAFSRRFLPDSHRKRVFAIQQPMDVVSTAWRSSGRNLKSQIYKLPVLSIIVQLVFVSISYRCKVISAFQLICADGGQNRSPDSILSGSLTVGTFRLSLTTQKLHSFCLLI
jgi:hypothetical protein